MFQARAKMPVEWDIGTWRRMGENVLESEKFHILLDKKISKWGTMIAFKMSSNSLGGSLSIRLLQMRCGVIWVTPWGCQQHLLSLWLLFRKSWLSVAVRGLGGRERGSRSLEDALPCISDLRVMPLSEMHRVRAAWWGDGARPFRRRTPEKYWQAAPPPKMLMMPHSLIKRTDLWPSGF